MMTMDYKALIDEQVKRRLEDTFGTAVAMLIVMSASNAANISIHSPSREDYMRLVDAVCADQRVKDMWGASGCIDQLSKWRALA